MKTFAFKTNVRNDYQVLMVSPVINQIRGIQKWSIDFNDKNKVLKVEGYGLNSSKITEQIIEAGFDCEKLY